MCTSSTILPLEASQYDFISSYDLCGQIGIRNVHSLILNYPIPGGVSEDDVYDLCSQVGIINMYCIMYILNYPTPGGLSEDDVYDLCSQVRNVYISSTIPHLEASQRTMYMTSVAR